MLVSSPTSQDRTELGSRYDQIRRKTTRIRDGAVLGKFCAEEPKLTYRSKQQ